jgi:hypothetical protein
MYKIVIPSYDRLNIIKKKVLEFLKKINISGNDIFIFVDPRSYEKYKEDNDLSKYNLISGKMGLANQRNFIRDYFPEGEFLIHCDDDLKSLNSNEYDLLNEINETFNLMVKYNILLGSFEPTGNKYFVTDEIKIGHYLSMGACYPEINSHNKNLYLESDENEKEDYIRTIKHIRLNGYTLRNNKISIVHTSSLKSSMGNLTNLERIKQREIALNNIMNNYSYLLFLRKKKSGYEIRFKNNLKRLKSPKYEFNENILLGDYMKYNDDYNIVDNLSEDYEFYDNGKLVFRLIRKAFNWNNIDITDIKHYLKTMSKLSTNRGNFAGKLDINKLEKWQLNKIKNLGGEVKLNKYKTATDKKDTGFSWSNPVKSFTIKKNSTLYKKICKNENITTAINEITKQLNDIYNEYLAIPEGLDIQNKFLNSNFDEFIFNYNIQSAVHKDSHNSEGYSIMVTWGNYTGYELVLPDYNILLKIKKGDILIFDGKKIRHGNLEGSGNRISIVGYCKK